MTSVFDTDPERTNNFRNIERRLITDGADLRGAPCRTLYRWWTGFAPATPTRVDFDITKTPTIASDIYMLEILEPGRYLYRLCGDNVARLVGRNYRMKEISITGDDLPDALLCEYMDWMVGTGGTSGCTGDFTFLDRGQRNFESVDCPLVDADGKTTHIIGAMCEV
jgi:hypothetical protein